MNRVMTQSRSRETFVISLLTLLMALGPVAADELPPALQDLRDFYDSVETVHVRAEVEISIRAPLDQNHPAPVTGRGTIEHWESGRMFRTRASLDPRLRLVEDLEIAMDGDSYQIRFTASDVLAVEEPDLSEDGLVQVPLPTPNPFYLPALFLAPSDDRCPGCQMTLDYLGEPGRWTGAFSALRSGWSQAERLAVAGGEREGVPYGFELVTRGSELGAPARELSRIRRLRADGTATASIELSELEPVAGAEGRRFPRRIVLRALDPDASAGRELISVAEYRIEVLEVNGPLDAATFTLSPGEKTALWDRGTYRGRGRRQDRD
jgi:hypothetical protein